MPLRYADLTGPGCVLALLVCGCDGASQVAPGATTVAFASSNIADTIDAQKSIVVTVMKGIEAVADTTVKFETVSKAAAGAPSVLVRTLSARTDAAGKATLSYPMDWVAGDYYLRATVPGTSAADSIPLTVEPGNVETIALFPRDSVLNVGGSYVVRTVAKDRRRNARPAVATTFTMRAGAVASIGDSTVTGQGFGRTALVGQVGLSIDSVFVTTVPQGVIAATRVGNGKPPFYVVRLDGTIQSSFTLDTVVMGDRRTPRFNSTGDRILFSSAQDIFTVGLDGKNLQLMTSKAPSAFESQGQYARDGSTIFFAAFDDTTDLTVWRVPAGGGTKVRVSPAGEREYWPTPSPDGSRIAYLWQSNASFSIRVRTLATGAVDTTTNTGTALRWSPTTNEIAYVESEQLRLYDAASHIVTTLPTPYRQYLYPHIDWSPDGAWLITCVYTGELTDGGLPKTMLVLVRRSPLLVLRLPWSQTMNLCEASWKP